MINLIKGSVLFVMFSSISSYAAENCIKIDREFQGDVIVQLPTELHVNMESVNEGVLWDSGWLTSTSIDLNCTTSGTNDVEYSKSIFRSFGKNNTISTGIPGIRMEVSYKDNYSHMPDKNLLLEGFHGAHGSGHVKIDDQFRVKLIQDGIVKSGITQFSGPIIAHLMDKKIISSLRIMNTKINIIPTGCEIADSNIMVSLGKHDKSEFGSAIGSVSAYKKFSIPLKCSEETVVGITLNSSKTTTFPGVISIDHMDGSAHGIGVQILNEDGSPVVFGQRRELRNMWNGNYTNIGFLARYFKTESKIAPGEANATATFSISYR